MARRKTELNLQAELPEVRSTDFNLFYRPEAKPVDKSIDIFTKALAPACWNNALNLLGMKFL